jgi:hypothetical protein
MQQGAWLREHLSGSQSGMNQSAAEGGGEGTALLHIWESTWLHPPKCNAEGRISAD